MIFSIIFFLVNHAPAEGVEVALRTPLCEGLELAAPRRVAPHRGEQPLVRLGQIDRSPVGHGSHGIQCFKTSNSAGLKELDSNFDLRAYEILIRDHA